jgi:hypothetical protein
MTCAQAFEKPTWFDDRRMVDPSGDDVITLITKRKKISGNQCSVGVGSQDEAGRQSHGMV